MEVNFRCSKCGSSQTRFRVKTKDRFCYVCGKITNIEIEEGKIINDNT